MEGSSLLSNRSNKLTDHSVVPRVRLLCGLKLKSGFINKINYMIIQSRDENESPLLISLASWHRLTSTFWLKRILENGENLIWTNLI